MPFKAVKPESKLLASARDVPPDIAQKQIQEEIPVNWRYDPGLWGYLNKYMIPDSGIGFVTPPYVAYWERVWGAQPIEDLPKYKELYTFTPYIKASVDVIVNLMISNGFELEGGDDNIREWLTDWLDEHNVLQTLRVVAADLFISGNAYLEICRDEDSDVNDWWLKPLDPVYMRVRRDQYGNVFGYIQLLTFPPVAFEPQDMIHFKWCPKSWWYEYSYGTSQLRPLILVQSLIDDFQTDMATIMKIYTKPMLTVTCGTPDRPFSDAQMTAVVNAFANRGPATDVFVRGDVQVKTITSMTREINVQWWIDYLHAQRQAVLAVPDIFLGNTKGTNRATADIVMQEFVTRLRMGQEILGDTLETVLFAQLIDAQFGEGNEIPHVKWRPIWEPIVPDKAKYLDLLVKDGIMGISESRGQLGLPEEIPAEATPELQVLPQEIGVSITQQASGATGTLPIQEMLPQNQSGGTGATASRIRVKRRYLIAELE
jgi:hypothetical protein